MHHRWELSFYRIRQTFVCLPKHAHIPTHPDGLLFTDDDGEALRGHATAAETLDTYSHLCPTPTTGRVRPSMRS